MPKHIYTLHWKSGNWEVFDSIEALVIRVNRIHKNNQRFVTRIEID